MIPPARNPLLPDAGQAALVGLFVLALLTALWLAQVIVVPLLGAMVLYLVLRPVVNWLARFRLPRVLSAAVLLAVALAGIGTGAAALREPAVSWLDRAPQIAYELRRKLVDIREPVQKAKEASEKVESIAKMPDDEMTQEVVVKEPGLIARMSGDVGRVTAGLLMMLVLLFFLLASGDALLPRLIGALPHVGSRSRGMRMLEEVQGDVARYLGMVSVINAGLGLCLWLGFSLSGLPNPGLWAVLAACLNFVPYVGALVMVVLVSLISVLSFGGLTAAMVPPLVYVALSTLEGQFVTPMLVGRRLRLNPLLVVLAVLFWAWMWGVAGALLALPMLVAVRALASNVSPLKGVAQALGAGAPTPAAGT